MSDNKAKISKESAEGQIDGFCAFYALDPEDMNDGMAAAYMEARKRLVKHIMAGRTECDGHTPIILTEDGKKLTCATLQGKHKVEMAKCGSDDNYVKIYALVASLTGLHPTGIHKFEGAYLSVVECWGMLFLQV